MSDAAETASTPDAPSDSSAIERLDASLAALRADDRRRRIAFAFAILVGLALAWLHWLGLVVAGALVGLTRRSLRRAIRAGFGFGLLTILVLFLTVEFAAPALTTLQPLSYLTVGLALLGPTWGAMLRGAL